jgi:hypothetical protein
VPALRIARAAKPANADRVAVISYLPRVASKFIGQLSLLELVPPRFVPNGRRRMTMSDIPGYSDEELKELVHSEVGERKKAFAAEVLRRRREANWNAWARKYPFPATILSALGLGTVIRWIAR